jgi:hypothetical protein
MKVISSLSRLGRRIAVPLVLLAVLTPPSAANAYTQNLYNSSYNNQQAMNCWCVVGSIRTWLGYIPGSQLPSQSTINSLVTSKDKYNNTTVKCKDGSSGHDPRGWAWGMYNYTPGSYFYDDYQNTSQSTMDWEMVYGVRATRQPVGSFVMAGQHAVLILGYQDLNDPFADKAQQLNGFYIFDPWYGRGNSGIAGWGYGFEPDHYFTIAQWNSTYYTKDTNDGKFWSPRYVAVLRAVSGTPSDSPPQTYGDWYYANSGAALANGPVGSTAAAPDVVATGASTSSNRTFGVDTAEPTVAAAVAEGLATNSLGGHNSMGMDLSHYTIGAVAHVDSLDSALPSYELAELRVDGQIRAIAMVDDTPAGYLFGALSEAGPNYPYATPSIRAQYESANGVPVSSHLVWGWADEGESPFYPFIATSDTITGSTEFLTPTGVFRGLHLGQANVPGK